MRKTTGNQSRRTLKIERVKEEGARKAADVL